MARWIPPQILTPAGVNHYGIGFDGLVGHFLYRDGTTLRHRKTVNGGRDWTEPVTVATSVTEIPLEHAVAVSGDTVHVAFERADTLIYLRSDDGGATWDTEVTLDDPAGTGFFYRLSIRAVGDVVHLVFARLDDADFSTDGLFYRRSEDDGVTWDSVTEPFPSAVAPTRPSMALDGTTVHVVWADSRDDPGEAYTGNPGEIYHGVSTDGGDTWAETRLTDTDGGTAHRPDVIAYDGVVTVTWQDPGPGAGDEEIFSVSSTDGGDTWGSITQITTTTVLAEHAFLANDGADAVMVYTDRDDSVGTAKVRWSTDCGQTWGSEETPWGTGVAQAAPRTFYTPLYVGIACEWDANGVGLLFSEVNTPSRAVKAGAFRLNTATGQQAVTGIGFQPVAGIFWLSKNERDGAGTDLAFSLGFAVSSTSRCCVSVKSDDTPTTMDTAAGDSTTKLLRLFADATGPTLDCEVDFVSWDADGFTVDVTDAPAADYIVQYLVFAAVEAELFSFSTVAAASQDVTSLARQPDVLFMFDRRGAAAGDAATLYLNLGVAARGSGQGAIALVDTDGAGTSQVKSWQRNDSALLGLFLGTSTAEQKRGRVTSWASNGFTVTWDTQSGDGETVRGLALKGGQWWAGAETQKTSAGTQAKTGVGFAPHALLTLTSAVTAAAGIARRDAILCMGAADEREEHVTGIATDDGAGLANTNRNYRSGKATEMINVNGGVVTEADLSSFDADGFTLDWTTADATARELLLVAVRTVFEKTGGGVVGVVGSGASELAGGGTVYEKTGGGVHPAVASGADAVEYAETGGALVPTTGSGADAVTFTEAGGATVPAVASGADAFTATETGGVTVPVAGSGADAVTFTEAGGGVAALAPSGADQVEFVETGGGVIGAAGSGSKEFVTGGGTTYAKTGGGIVGVAPSGADAVEHVETGGATIPTAAAGADTVEYAETGGAAVPTTGSGASEYEQGGAAYVKTGGGLIGVAGSGGKATIHTETGTVTVTATPTGLRAVEFVETGGATVPVAGSGASEFDPYGGVTYEKTGGGLLGTAGSGARAVVYTETGAVLVQVTSSGLRVTEYAETGGAVVAVVGSGENDSNLLTAVFDAATPAAAHYAAATPAGGHYDAPTPNA